MTLPNRILLALEQGMNLDRLLMASGIDKATFFMKLDENQFTYDERIALTQEVKDWEGGR